MRWIAELEAGWREEAEEAFSGMKEWRVQHPKASLSLIEAALDERLARVRARMLQDVALSSAAVDLTAARGEERPRCPGCGLSLEARGPQERTLTTHHDRTIRLERSYAECPTCQVGLFPPGRGA